MNMNVCLYNGTLYQYTIERFSYLKLESVLKCCKLKGKG